MSETNWIFKPLVGWIMETRLFFRFWNYVRWNLALIILLCKWFVVTWDHVYKIPSFRSIFPPSVVHYVLLCPAELSFSSYISSREEFPFPWNQSRKQHCMQVVQFQHTWSVHTFKCQESCACVNHTWFFQECEVEPNNKIFQGKLKHRFFLFE